MDPTVIAIAIVVGAVLLVLLFRRGDRARRIGLDQQHTTTPRQRMERSGAALSDADADEMLDLLRRGRKIEAIKLVRERTGLGLKEAKEFVEHQHYGHER
jgi:ribosomal protein L7/L12